MRFLVDESCDIALVQTLRAAGWDVIAVAEQCPGAADADVIVLAAGQNRILVTEDKDFGQLVYASGHGHCGVIFLRYPFPLAAHIAENLAALVKRQGAALSSAFVVIRPGSIRILNPPLSA